MSADYPESTPGSVAAGQARAHLNSATPEKRRRLFLEGLGMIFRAIRPNPWKDLYEAEKRERMRIADGKWWYKTRVDLLLEKQHMLREPERTLVIDILANGQLLPDPDGSRYGHPK